MTRGLGEIGMVGAGHDRGVLLFDEGVDAVLLGIGREEGGDEGVEVGVRLDSGIDGTGGISGRQDLS